MNRSTIERKAERFRQLHEGDRVLCLLNAWDAGTARIFETQGCPALATTSAGVAYAHGRADGELGREQMIEAVRQIATACEIPVSADIESGYGANPGQVAETVAAVIAAGAVGVNIEDAAEGGSSELRELGAQCARLGAAREAAEECDLDLFINARTDAFLLKAGARKQRLERAIERLHAYLEAGADGVFVPGLVDPDQIGRIADAVSAPLNVLAAPLTPSLQELGKLGVRRLSTGSAPARVALALVQRISAEVLEDGSLGSLWNEAIPYAEANRLFGG